MLTDPDVIRVLLARLIAARAPLFAFVDGCDERFTTTLLELDHGLRALIADELHPSRGHAQVRKGGIVRLSSRLDGVEMRFVSRVRAIDADGAIAAYLIDIPSALDYREHRRLRRLAARNISAELVGCGQSAQARVLDISIGGMRLAVAVPHPIGADEIWDCSVALPNGAFDATLAVVRVRPARSRTRAGAQSEDDIGTRFGPLTTRAARRIGRFMADSQRETLRARAIGSGRLC